MRKKQKLGVIKAFCLWLVVFTIVGFSPMDQNNQMKSTMADIIRRQVDEICSLKIKIMDLSTEIVRLKSEKVEDKQVLEAINCLTEGAVRSDWANPNNVRRIKNVCQKYEYIIKDVKHEYANWKFMFAICVTATGCNPNHKYYNEWNKTCDWGLGDINDCNLKWLDADKRMPKELKGRSWLDVEKSIAGRYIHLDETNKRRQPWALLDKRGWLLYSKINNYEKVTVYAK